MGDKFFYAHTFPKSVRCEQNTFVILRLMKELHKHSSDYFFNTKLCNKTLFTS